MSFFVREGERKKKGLVYLSRNAHTHTMGLFYSCSSGSKNADGSTSSQIPEPMSEACLIAETLMSASLARLGKNSPAALFAADPSLVAAFMTEFIIDDSDPKKLLSRWPIAACSVYTMGSNDHGQLGIGTWVQTRALTEVESLTDKRIYSVACGLDHTVIAAHDGIWAAGYNGQGQLGSADIHDMNTFVHGPVFPGRRVRMVACGKNTTYALLDDGTMHWWGVVIETAMFGGHRSETTTTPRQVPFPAGVRIASIASALEHAAAVTHAGDLYMWGRGTFGQLGNGVEPSDYDLVWPPRKVQGVSDVGLVVCGERHTAAIAGLGEVYTWGMNNCGQLGTGRAGGHPRPPVRVDALRGCVVCSLACSDRHTIATTMHGEVFAWGDTAVTVERDGIEFYVDASPRQMHWFDTKDIVCVRAGSAGAGATVAVAVSSSGAMHTWAFRPLPAHTDDGGEDSRGSASPRSLNTRIGPGKPCPRRGLGQIMCTLGVNHTVVVCY